MPSSSQCSVLPSQLPMRPSSLQDQNSEGDLWDLAIIEGGDAVRRPASSSPFASKALLTCFNSDVRSAPNPSLCAHFTYSLHSIICSPDHSSSGAHLTARCCVWVLLLAHPAFADCSERHRQRLRASAGIEKSCCLSQEEDSGPWWPQASRRTQRGNSALAADTSSPAGEVPALVPSSCEGESLFAMPA